MITAEEYQSRIVRLQESIKQAGLDAMVVRTDPNITYLVGIHCHSMERKVLLIVPAKGEPTLIVPRMEKEQLSRSPSVKSIEVYWEKDAKPERSWQAKLNRALTGVNRVGIDPLADIELSIALEDYEWVVSELVEELRMIKSPAEVGMIRKAATYWTSSMNRMLRSVKAGMTVGELMAVGGQISSEVFEKEPNANWINTRVVQFFQCSPASGSPHHLSYRADEVLPDGPTILNAVGAICDYSAENERTILTGDYTQQHAELFDLTQTAHEMALRLIRPRVPCAEVDHAVQEFFIKEGVEDYMRHRVGHGFGLLEHERPYTSEGSSDIYQANMVISVEPGLYIEGVGGTRHSDTVLITESGIDVMTSATPIDRPSLTF